MFQGSMVALVTPMLGDGLVDDAALADLIEFHIESGTDAIVAVGTTGESATLTVPEHARVIKQIIDSVGKRVPVIAGTGANATAEAIELTAYARGVGADACLLVTPYYNKPTQEGLFLHFEAVSKAVDIPQILYNVPGRTAVDMLPATTARLSHLTNIIGIKEAFGSIERIRQLLEVCADDFMIVTGDDATDAGRRAVQRGGLAVDRRVVALFGPRRVVREAQFLDLAFAQPADGASEEACNLGAERCSDSRGARQEKVASDDGLEIAPLRVDSLDATPRVGLVHHVIVVERPEVNEFARHTTAYDVVGCRAAEDLRSNRRQHGPKPLAAGNDQMRRELGEIGIGSDNSVIHRSFNAAAVTITRRERQQRRRLRTGRDVLEGHPARLRRDRATGITMRALTLDTVF